MAQAIPQAIELRVAQTLAQWRAWDCQPKLREPPRGLEVLAGGLSNYSFIVGDTDKYVIRIDGPQLRENHLSRTLEWRVLHCAARAGIAPTPRYFNPDLGALVCDYHKPQATTKHPIAALADLLRVIHALPAMHQKLNLEGRLSGYERALGKRHIPLPNGALREQAMDAQKNLDTNQEEHVLCHNDLLSANRLNTTQGLLAIDWEYSAMGSRWFDLAVIIVGDRLGSEQKSALIMAYLKRPATPEEALSLECHIKIYQYLEALWHLVNNCEQANP